MMRTGPVSMLMTVPELIGSNSRRFRLNSALCPCSLGDCVSVCVCVCVQDSGVGGLQFHVNDTHYAAWLNGSAVCSVSKEDLRHIGSNVASSEAIRDSLFIVVPITCVYALIFLFGLVGNVSTCVVIARSRHMHTATNYYLFSLALSDLLLLVSGLPPEICHIWSRYPYLFGEVFCVLQG